MRMSLKGELLLAVCCICSSFCFTRSMAAIIVGFVVSASQMNWRERVSGTKSPNSLVGICSRRTVLPDRLMVECST